MFTMFPSEEGPSKFENTNEQVADEVGRYQSESSPSQPDWLTLGLYRHHSLALRVCVEGEQAGQSPSLFQLLFKFSLARL